MNREAAKEIIKNEKLQNYCLFCDEKSNESEIVIEKIRDKWIVYTNNERATKTSEKNIWK